MTLPGNGTGKRIVAGIVVGVTMLVIAALSGAVISNASRITVMEARMDFLVKTADQTLTQVEKNGDVNYSEHKEMRATLDDIAKEIRK
ncbi:MAG: hypothetical protein IMZ46_02325 [Acidobacteria bacterium]|nr:hypothetical protein [Acidobacteriota bacterium]